MFKELDQNEVTGTHFSDLLVFWRRLLDVLFYDVQLFASGE